MKKFLGLIVFLTAYSSLASTWKQVETKAFDRTASIESRWEALMSLRKAPQKVRDAFYSKAFRQTDWLMRNGALLAMKRINRGKAIAWAERALTDRAMIVRVAALNVLKDLNARQSAERVWRSINHKSQFRSGQALPSRRTAVKTLMTLSSNRQHWQKLLRDGDETVRVMAAKVLKDLESVSQH